MNRITELLTGIIMVLILLSGCALEPQTKPSEPICLVETERTRAMEISEDILTGLGFIVDKYDLDKGIIRTKPLRAPQSFEFWRSDNVTAFNAAEANLHSIQRTAELLLTEVGGQTCLSCKVQVRRLSFPEKKVEGASEAPGMFTASSRVLQKLRIDKGREAVDVSWIDLGYDPALETEILKRIKNKSEKLRGVI